jgi:hypothetical protein
MPQELSPKLNEAENHGKRRAAKPFPTTENKESRFCPVQTIDGFGETKVIHPCRSTIETWTCTWQRAQRQYSGGVGTFAGGSDGIRFSLIKQPTRSYRVMALHTHTPPPLT